MANVNSAFEIRVAGNALASQVLPLVTGMLFIFVLICVHYGPLYVAAIMLGLKESIKLKCGAADMRHVQWSWTNPR